MASIVTKNTDPSTVPTPSTGKTAFGTNLSSEVFIKDDTGAVTIITSGGTVTSVGITGNDGISVSGSPVTTSGSITLDLGNITPTSVAATGTVTGSNLSGTNTGDQTLNSLLPSQTGNNGKILGTDGTNSSWVTAPATGVTSVAASSANAAISVSGSPITSTGTLTLTANTFTSTDPGVAPASGGGTSNYLRADGTWASPGGGVTSFNTRTGAVTLSSGDVTTALGFTPGVGTVTSVGVSGGTTGLSFSGGPITGSGTITAGGVLAIANGGTGESNATDAFQGLSPMTTNGDLITQAAGVPARLGVGSDGQVLTVVSGAPAWATGGGGGVTSVTGTTNQITVTGTSTPVLSLPSTGVVLPGTAAVTVPVGTTAQRPGTPATGNLRINSSTVGGIAGSLEYYSGAWYWLLDDSLFRAKGNLMVGTGTTQGSIASLTTGTNGQVLTVDTSTATGLKWATASGGGGTTSALQAVEVATTANGTLASAFANGQTVDGITLATGNRILLKNQTTQADNGIYTVNASGAPTRAADFTTGTAVGGVLVPVLRGTKNSGMVFQCMNTLAITVGTSAITFRPTGGTDLNSPATWTTPSATGASAIAKGNGASAAGDNSVAIGTTAAANTSSTIAIGNTAAATGNGTIAIGNGASATVGNSISIGQGAKTTQNNSIRISGMASSPSTGSGTLVNIGAGTMSQLNSICITATDYAYNVSGFGGSIFLGNGFWADAAALPEYYVGIMMANGWQTTTDATATEVGVQSSTATNTPSGYLALANRSMYMFEVDIAARKHSTGTDYSAWKLQFAINREANAASTALVGTPILTLIGQTAGASGWTVAVTADTTDGRPAIKVTGQAATTIRWVMNMRITRCSS